MNVLDLELYVDHLIEHLKMSCYPENYEVNEDTQLFITDEDGNISSSEVTLYAFLHDFGVRILRLINDDFEYKGARIEFYGGDPLVYVDTSVRPYTVKGYFHQDVYETTLPREIADAINNMLKQEWNNDLQHLLKRSVLLERYSRQEA